MCLIHRVLKSKYRNIELGNSTPCLTQEVGRIPLLKYINSNLNKISYPTSSLSYFSLYDSKMGKIHNNNNNNNNNVIVKLRGNGESWQIECLICGLELIRSKLNSKEHHVPCCKSKYLEHDGLPYKYALLYKSIPINKIK